MDYYDLMRELKKNILELAKQERTAPWFIADRVMSDLYDWELELEGEEDQGNCTFIALTFKKRGDTL